MVEQLYISKRVSQKLKNKHKLTNDEVLVAWGIHQGTTLFDMREQHKTTPLTEWFIVKSAGKMLKIVFVMHEKCAVLKTAYTPNQTEINVFLSEGGKI